MVEKPKKVIIREIPSKVKIIKEEGQDKDESMLEKQVEDSYADFSSPMAITDFTDPSLKPTNAPQAASDNQSPAPRPADDSGFAMSRSYSSAREVQSSRTDSTRTYQAMQQVSRSLDPGLRQDSIALERPTFRNTELSQMRNESLEPQYKELSELPKDTRNMRKLPWEI